MGKGECYFVPILLVSAFVGISIPNPFSLNLKRRGKLYLTLDLHTRNVKKYTDIVCDRSLPLCFWNS